MNRLDIALGYANLARVGYVDVTVPAEVVGLEASQVTAVSWGSPDWSEGEQVRVGAAAWFAELGGKRVVFDPVQAADGVLRADRASEAAHQSAIAQAFAAAGFARESIDLVVMSHIEGVGMVAWRDDDGRWAPYFPHARILISDVSLREFQAAGARPADDIEHAAWRVLIDSGVVDTYTNGQAIVPGLTAVVRGGHCAGHATFDFGPAGAVSSGTALADTTPDVTMLGHLAVSPLHFATAECPALHADPALAWSLLHQVAADGRTLIGPLWPTPGYGRWVDGAWAAGGPRGSGTPPH